MFFCLFCFNVLFFCPVSIGAKVVLSIEIALLNLDPVNNIVYHKNQCHQ